MFSYVISLVLTKKTTSNEYRFQETFQQKDSFKCKQRYLIETCIAFTNWNIYANIDGVDLILFAWTARNANDIDWNLANTISNSAFCTKNNCSCRRNHLIVERLRLTSFEISCNAKSKDYDPSADCWILNSFETHSQSPGLNYSKRSIGNVGIRPIQEYLLLFVEKQRWPF